MFIHLHNHTKFSILDALCQPKALIARAKELGQDAIAITDHGVVYGWIEFYKECMEQGVKPILGCELYVAPKTVEDKDKNERYHHLVALAENNEGMKNLQKLCSAGFMDGGVYYGKPRVDDNLLEKYHEGIIFLSGCVAGRIPSLLLKDDYNGAKEAALKYGDMFGEGNFFLEIQDHNDVKEHKVTQELVRMSAETGIPLVATNDCHYINPGDAEAHEILLYMRDQKIMGQDISPAYGDGQLYLKSEGEMKKLFKAVPEALENTARIAERCNVEIKFHETKMPKAPIPEGLSAYEYLTKLCLDGLKERYPDDDGKIRKQLEYELSVIKKMGFVEYFLVVWEYINWSRNNGVKVGPGRGSAAGSVAMYCLGITDIDPEHYDLVFERFLNPERVSNPDIDEDLDDVNRYRTIAHVKELYGEKNVCQIITFGTMAAKKVLKNVGKVYGYEVPFYNELASLVPKDPYITLQKALEESIDFKKRYEEDGDAKKIIDMGLLLESLPCNTSKHAAGVIIADKPVMEHIPLAVTKDGDLVSQFNMIEIEELGLLKMDFLGLKTLSVISGTFDNIKRTTGKELTEKDIDLADAEVYKFISSGKTAGVFQLESSGMMSFMKQLKPRTIEDLIAGVALYRPGPMDFIPKYIKGKNDPEAVSYVCPELKPILETTYGCIVYQEQVMQIFRQLAGYSLGGADNIRRAMSKKKQHVIDEERKTFVYGNLDTEEDPAKQIKGCVGNGISEKAANDIYDSMTDFAKYAFNKSHAACYAVISYQTAWLKYHYPAEYMASIMSTFIGDTNKLAAYAYSAKEQEIKVLGPDINKSMSECTVENGAIRLPLSACKGVGDNVVEDIINRREEKSYESLDEFLKRMADIKKSALESLIKAGAFDPLGKTRSTLLSCYESSLKSLKKDIKENIPGQMSLFDITGNDAGRSQVKDLPEFSQKELLSLEKEAIGMYVTANPLDAYIDFCEKYSDCRASDFEPDPETGMYDLGPNRIVHLCGIITEIKKTYTKNGESMAFVKADDGTGTIDTVIFPRTLSELQEPLEEDGCYLFTGITSESRDDDKSMSVIVRSIENLESVKFNLWIRIKNEGEMDKTLYAMDNIQRSNEGPGQIILYLSEEKKKIPVNRLTHIQNKGKFEKFFGKENVAVR